MKTFRRDKLRKLIEAGRVVTVGTYSFDDMSGERQTSHEMPVAMYPESGDWHDCKPGTVYLRHHDLTSKSGCAWMRPDGTVTLIVHGNSNYDFRITGE
jgi:hypothetical protein